jgi:hypothetical protein
MTGISNPDFYPKRANVDKLVKVAGGGCSRGLEKELKIQSDNSSRMHFKTDTSPIQYRVVRF